MLWTIVPIEWVLAEEPPGVDWSAGQAAVAPVLAEVTIGSGRVVLETGPDGRARVHRVLSTDPADYLRPELQPGSPWTGIAR